MRRPWLWLMVCGVTVAVAIVISFRLPCRIDPCRCKAPALTLKGPSRVEAGSTAIYEARVEPVMGARMPYLFHADRGEFFPAEDNTFPTAEFHAPDQLGRLKVSAECRWCAAKSVKAVLEIEVIPRGGVRDGRLKSGGMALPYMDGGDSAAGVARAGATNAMASEEVIAKMAAAMGFKPLPPGLGGRARDQVVAAATAFEACIRPGIINARANPAELGERVFAFLAKRALDDDAVLQLVIREFDASAPPPDSSSSSGGTAQSQQREGAESLDEKEKTLRDDFAAFVRDGLDRFRTYDSRKLRLVIESFRKWRSTIRYLEGLDPGNAIEEKWVVAFRDKVAEQIAGALHVDRSVAQDAVHTALLDELKKLRPGPGGGNAGAARGALAAWYVYEGSFDGWLKNAAYNRCRGFRRAGWRDSQRISPTPVEENDEAALSGVDLPGIERRLAAAERLREVLDAFALVLSSANDPAGFRSAWAEILLEGVDETDRAAAVQRQRATELNKYKLRSRLMAVLFTREQPTCSDEDLIDYLRRSHRYIGAEQTTYLKLATLTRAAHGESLLYPAAMNYLVSHGRTVDQVRDALPTLAGLPDAHHRLLAAEENYHFDARLDRWHPLPGGRRGRYVAACCYAELWRRAWTTEEAARLLHASPADDIFARSYASVNAPLIRALNGRPPLLGAAVLRLLESHDFEAVRQEFAGLEQSFFDAAGAWVEWIARGGALKWEWAGLSGIGREATAAVWLREHYPTITGV